MGLLDRFRGKKRALRGKAVPDDAPMTAADGAPEKPYVGVYERGVEYAMTRNPKNGVCALEVHDSTGRYLSGREGPGMGMPQAMYFAAFALTEDEYALRRAPAVGKTNPQVNDLVGRLLERLPKDRLLAVGKVDAATKQPGPHALEPKCDTMDANAYRRDRDARALKRLEGLEQVWVTTSRATGEAHPAVDAAGFAWVFEQEDYAKAAAEANPRANLAYRCLDAGAFRAFVRDWYRLGVVRMKLNPGGNGFYGEIERDAFAPREDMKRWDCHGSMLAQLILRLCQSRAIADDPNAKAQAATYWDAICHALPDTPLLVPVRFDGDAEAVEDRVVYLTRDASALLRRLEAKRESGGVPVREGSEEAAQPAGTDRFWGGEGRSFTEAEDRSMRLCLASNGGGQAFCAFTDFTTMDALFAGKARAMVFTFDELAARLGKGVTGLRINPGGVGLGLSRADVATVNRVRAEKPKIYVAPKSKEA